MKRLLIVLALFILPNANAQRAIGIGLQGWDYNSNHQLVLHLVNNSKKTITAYGITVHATYTDNTASTFQASEDYLGPLVDEGKAIFPAGAAHDVLLASPQPVLTITATPDVVIYSDGTSDVNNQHAYHRIMGARQGQILAAQKANEVVNQMLNDPTVSDPLEAAARELTRQADVLHARVNFQTGDPEGRMEGHLRNYVRNMQTESERQNHREYLQEFLKKNQARIDAIKPHVLREVAQ